jgi:hypothetical protein
LPNFDPEIGTALMTAGIARPMGLPGDMSLPGDSPATHQGPLKGRSGKNPPNPEVDF